MESDNKVKETAKYILHDLIQKIPKMISVSSYSLPEENENYPSLLCRRQFRGNKPELKSTYISQKREM